MAVTDNIHNRYLVRSLLIRSRVKKPWHMNSSTIYLFVPVWLLNTALCTSMTETIGTLKNVMGESLQQRRVDLQPSLSLESSPQIPLSVTRFLLLAQLCRLSSWLSQQLGFLFWLQLYTLSYDIQFYASSSTPVPPYLHTKSKIWDITSNFPFM